MRIRPGIEPLGVEINTSGQLCVPSPTIHPVCWGVYAIELPFSGPGGTIVSASTG
jgi:hypothetical protein